MILLIQNDKQDNNSLMSCLNRVGAECDKSLCIESALVRCRQRQYPVIVIAIKDKLQEQISWIQRLQSALPMTSIVVVSKQGCEAERILSLELGAQDYIEFPANPVQLQARVRVELRRSRIVSAIDTQSANAVRIGSFYIDHSYHRAEYNGHSLSLTATEFELLYFLARHPDQVFSRPQLLASVWGYNYSGYEHTVNSLINRLRSKLTKICDCGDLVQTVWGVGYKFNPGKAAEYNY
ncbi:response regulator transcription factor [Alteromonas facilis]|uniref:response regulator transcription factor n=1 Tax=Alteromonas facilis TaxID=2048004 RepID=UPI000C282F4A|nr:winged helix-turn-helix domain-containing protein [Alteromonas facilis]